jgi:hypothetical protein
MDQDIVDSIMGCECCIVVCVQVHLDGALYKIFVIWTSFFPTIVTLFYMFKNQNNTSLAHDFILTCGLLMYIAKLFDATHP